MQGFIWNFENFGENVSRWGSMVAHIHFVTYFEYPKLTWGWDKDDRDFLPPPPISWKHVMKCEKKNSEMKLGKMNNPKFMGPLCLIKKVGWGFLDFWVCGSATTFLLSTEDYWTLFMPETAILAVLNIVCPRSGPYTEFTVTQNIHCTPFQNITSTAHRSEIFWKIAFLNVNNSKSIPPS